jgi:hypothetical protein
VFWHKLNLRQSRRFGFREFLICAQIIRSD